LVALLPDATAPEIVLLPVIASLSICIAALKGMPSNMKPGAAAAAPHQRDAAVEQSNEHCCPADSMVASAVRSPASAVAARPAKLRAELHGELMARVSHELRTPLNAVVGFADLMQHQPFGPLGHPRYAEYINHIRESSERLLKSAEDTLAMTSLLAVRADQWTEPVQIGQVVRDSVIAISEEVRSHGIQVAIEVDEDLEAASDRRVLRQAIVNLLGEAVSRSRSGAQITISCRRRADGIILTLTTSATRDATKEMHSSLALCLARTLLELAGSNLRIQDAGDARWRADVHLERAAQADFFATLSTTEEACA